MNKYFISYVISKRSRQLAKFKVEKLRYLLAEYISIQPSEKYILNDGAFITLLVEEVECGQLFVSDILLAACLTGALSSGMSRNLSIDIRTHKMSN